MQNGLERYFKMVWKSKSVTGKLTDMKDFASGKWDAISSIAWSNAKSVWSALQNGLKCI